jgi:hypothetical protein
VGLQAPAAGRSVQFGPLLFGNLKNADGVLSGGSINVGLQLTPVMGFQVTGNSSGLLGGPAVGVPGTSINITHAHCWGGKKE